MFCCSKDQLSPLFVKGMIHVSKPENFYIGLLPELIKYLTENEY